MNNETTLTETKKQNKSLNLDKKIRIWTFRLSGVTFANPKIYRYIWKKHCNEDPNHTHKNLPKVRLRHDEENKYDKNAVVCEVELSNGWHHLGWIPTEYSTDFENDINKQVLYFMKHYKWKIFPMKIYYREEESSLNIPTISFTVQFEWEPKN